MGFIAAFVDGLTLDSTTYTVKHEGLRVRRALDFEGVLGPRLPRRRHDGPRSGTS